MSDKYYQDFLNDYNKLVDDSSGTNIFTSPGKYVQAFTNEQNAKAAYKEQYDLLCVKLENGGNPIAILALFMALGLTQGLSQEDNDVALQAAIMKIQGDVTKCNNDIAAMYTPNSDASIAEIALAEDTMLGVLSSTNLLPISSVTREALGSFTSGNLYTYMLSLRKQIFVEPDPNDPNSFFKTFYNPTQTAAGGPGEARTYYFDTAGDTSAGLGGNGYIGSIALLNSSLSTSGDPYQATEAMQAATDNNNLLNATLNSASSATQAILTNKSNIIQSWIAFLEDIGQSVLKVNSASTHNQIPA
jgi:hypothetical protein